VSVLAVGRLEAQQMYLDKPPAQYPPARTMRVAQQPTPYAQPNAYSGEPRPAPATAGGTANSSNTAAAAELDHDSPFAQALENNPCVDNGLWDGCDAGNCCSTCGGGYCQPAQWYTEQGARILARSRPRRVSLGIIFTQTTSPLTGQATTVPDDVLNTRSINYDVAAGYNATIGMYLGRDSMDRDDFLEFSYWGMNTWVDSALVQGQRVVNTTSFGRAITFGNIVSNFPSDVGGFNRADLQTLTVNSEMHNFELNLRLRPRGRPDQLIMNPDGRWRRQCQEGMFISYLAGLRYMTVGDGALWHSQGTFDDAGLNTIHFVQADYNVKTENDMLGLQIGTELEFRQCKWMWGVRAKVGPYLNFCRNVQDINTVPVGDPFTTVFINDRLTAKKQKAALVGEVGFEATYKFKPNLIGKAAYDFSWINGLALAPEQFQFSSNPIAAINTNGSIFMQGVTLSLEWCW
jgi:hypothetical protein